MQGGPPQSSGGLMPAMVGVHPQAPYPPHYMAHPGVYGPNSYGLAQAYPTHPAQAVPMPQPGMYPGAMPHGTIPRVPSPYQQPGSSPAPGIQQQAGMPQQQPPSWSMPPGYPGYGAPMPYGAPPPFAQPPLQPKPPMGVNQQTRRPADQQTPSPYPVMPESWQFPQAHPQAPPVYPVPTPAPSGGTTEEERAAWLAANKRKAEAKWQYDMALRQQQQIKAPSAKQGKSTSTKSGSQSIKAGGMSGLSGLPSLSGPGLSAISTKTKKNSAIQRSRLGDSSRSHHHQQYVGAERQNFHDDRYVSGQVQAPGVKGATPIATRRVPHPPAARPSTTTSSPKVPPRYSNDHRAALRQVGALHKPQRTQLADHQ